MVKKQAYTMDPGGDNRPLTPEKHRAFAKTRLHYTFKKSANLRNALTHPSFERRRASAAASAFERLEFLGDRILGLVIAEALVMRYPDEKEGELSRRHASLVSRETCRAIGEDLDLVNLVDAKLDGDWSVDTHVLADSVEAILGAVYMDAGGAAGGTAACEAIVHRLWDKYMKEQDAPPRDAKTALQEWLQGRRLPIPKYDRLGREGPEHAPVYKVVVKIVGVGECVGSGKTIKLAEKCAATLMMEEISSQEHSQ